MHRIPSLTRRFTCWCKTRAGTGLRAADDPSLTRGFVESPVSATSQSGASGDGPAFDLALDKTPKSPDAQTELSVPEIAIVQPLFFLRVAALMETLSIVKYSQLTAEEWARVARTAQRHVYELTGKDCDIGIGRKFRGGRPYGWQVSLRVYLPRKLNRVARSRRVPPLFEIRLKRGSSFVLLKIRSDVDSRNAFVPTGGRVRLGPRQFATGALLRWSSDDRANQWGFLTVAHEFDRTSRRTATVRIDSTLTFSCRLLFVSPQNRNLDAAIMQIQGDQQQIEDDLLDSNLIQAVDQPPYDLQSVRSVKASAVERRRGRTYPPGRSWRFVGEEVFPNGFQLGERRLDDCIRVGQETHDVFGPGTSGAMWKFGWRASCLQAGGRRPDFEDGIGQPYARVMPWVRERLGSTASIVSVF